MHFPFGEEIILENDVVRLAPVNGSNVDTLLNVASLDRNLLQFSPKPIYNKALLQGYIDGLLSGRKNQTRYAFSVFDKRQNAFAGCTGFLNISQPDDRLEIGGTWYGKPFQRTGLNRNCKYLLLTYAFDRLGAVRVAFRTDERNQQSRQAIEKIGGQYEGLLRQHMRMHDVYRRNTVCYSILKSEWAALQPTFLAPPA